MFYLNFYLLTKKSKTGYPWFPVFRNYFSYSKVAKYEHVAFSFVEFFLRMGD